MTYYRDRVIKVLYIPADERVAATVIEGKMVRELLQMSEIDYLERVNTQTMHDHDMVMAISEDGRDRRKPYNIRAHFLSGYAPHLPIVGDAFFMSERRVDDGLDFADLSDKALAYWNMMQDAEGLMGFYHWTQEYAQHLESHHHYFPPAPETYRR